MNVYLNEITGIADAIVSMHMSKRTWTRELEHDIRDTHRYCSTIDGAAWTSPCVLGKDRTESRNCKADKSDCSFSCGDYYAKYDGWLDKLLKWGAKHITLLRYIDFSITVEGLHRGGQD